MLDHKSINVNECQSFFSFISFILLSIVLFILIFFLFSLLIIKWVCLHRLDKMEDGEVNFDLASDHDNHFGSDSEERELEVIYTFIFWLLFFPSKWCFVFLIWLDWWLTYQCLWWFKLGYWWRRWRRWRSHRPHQKWPHWR